MQLQAAAAKRGIIIAPGPVFAAGQRYKNYLRLNCGFPSSPGSPVPFARSASSRPSWPIHEKLGSERFVDCGRGAYTLAHKLHHVCSY